MSRYHEAAEQAERDVRARLAHDPGDYFPGIGITREQWDAARAASHAHLEALLARVSELRRRDYVPAARARSVRALRRAGVDLAHVAPTSRRPSRGQPRRVLWAPHWALVVVELASALAPAVKRAALDRLSKHQHEHERAALGALSRIGGDISQLIAEVERLGSQHAD